MYKTQKAIPQRESPLTITYRIKSYISTIKEFYKFLSITF